MTHQPASSRSHALLACTLIVAGTVLGLAAIDLVLPSVPAMPRIFGTSIATSQLVLAGFVAGTAAGLLLFGSLASHFGRRRLFVASLVAFGLFSLAAAMVDNIWALIVIRILQGAAGSGSAMLAPGLIRSLFSEIGAMRAISLMGSIEALVPGLAPILGAVLFSLYGWQASFLITGIWALMIALIALLRPTLLPHIGAKQNTDTGSYWALVKNVTFLRYAITHAMVLGGLLTFVFTVPAVIINTMGGTIEHFIRMQFVGVCTFILSANLSGSMVKRFGIEPVISAGTVIACVGALVIAAYAFWGSNDPGHLPYMFWILNTGLGVRGGPGFMRGLAAAKGDDDRASALIILAIMGTAALATALVAPFIKSGLPALACAIVLIVVPSLLIIIRIKPLKD